MREPPPGVETDSTSETLRFKGGISGWKCAVAPLLVLLVVYGLLQSQAPLSTAIQIGADEGFELAKATACLHGHRLYSEVWNDQPPLHTILITEVARHSPQSLAGPRLLTVACTVLLLSALFLLVARWSGRLAAFVATALLIFSPGFLELSSSCMLEIPALSLAVAGLCLLGCAPQSRWRIPEVFTGVLFGAAMLTKLVPAIYLSMAAVMVGQRTAGVLAKAPGGGAQGDAYPFAVVSWRRAAISMAIVLAGAAASFIGIDLAIDQGAFLGHLGQTWSSHFSPIKVEGYGLPSDHPFQWAVLLRNWDTSVPALLGIAILLRRGHRDTTGWLPLTWLVLALGVFGWHQPWWAYYYVHTAIPLCWCAGIGFSAAWGWSVPGAEVMRRLAARGPVAKSRWGRRVALGLFVAAALSWMGARVYLECRHLRELPRTYASPLLTEIQRKR